MEKLPQISVASGSLFRRNKRIAQVTALGALAALEVVHLQSAGAAPVSFTGSAVANPHGGSVQVAITVDGGKITAISTPVQPGGSNSSFSNLAIPTLTSEALAAQSANINAVSGASQVSSAWIQSLSSAIAQAGSLIGVQAPVSNPQNNGGQQNNQLPSQPLTAPTAGNISVAPIPNVSLPTLSIQGLAPSSIYTNPALPSLASYISQINGYVSTITSSVGTTSRGEDGGGSTVNTAAIQSAVNGISTIESQIQGQLMNYGTNINGLSSQYAMNLNFQVADYFNKVNSLVTNYLLAAKSAGDKILAEAQASAAAISASPAPTVTVTATVTATPTEPPLSLTIGSGIIQKKWVCTKTVAGKVTKKVVTGLIAKCPLGFKAAV
jgi:uncharacterized protein with FMN-binding domain